MEDTFWYLFASSRGGETRALVIRELLDQPRNANQLAEALGFDYTTIRHHLEVLMDDNVIRKTGDGYGDLYLLTDQAQHHQDTLEEILDTVAPEEQ